jgi:hypothetical protein
MYTRSAAAAVQRLILGDGAGPGTRPATLGEAKMNSRLQLAATIALALSLSALTACPEQIALNLEINKGDEVSIDAPEDFGLDEFLLTADASIVSDVAEIPVDIVPDITVLTFENFTDFDVAISYFIEGIPQSVLVPFGQAVSIEYDPCLADAQLDYEDDFDPITGLYVGSFDLIDVALVEGADYLCGDEIFFTFYPDTVSASAQPL